MAHQVNILKYIKELARNIFCKFLTRYVLFIFCFYVLTFSIFNSVSFYFHFHFKFLLNRLGFFCCLFSPILPCSPLFSPLLSPALPCFLLFSPALLCSPPALPPALSCSPLSSFSSEVEFLLFSLPHSEIQRQICICSLLIRIFLNTHRLSLSGYYIINKGSKSENSLHVSYW